MATKVKFFPAGLSSKKWSKKRFVEKIPMDNEIRCYVFKNAKSKYIFALWDPSGKKRRIKIGIPVSQSRIKIIDTMGNEISPAVRKGNVIVDLQGGSPVYLLGKGALISVLKKAKVKDEKLGVKLKLLSLPAKTIGVLLNNSTSKNISLKANVVSFPSDWQLKEKKKEIKLAPEEEKLMTFYIDKACFSPERKDYEIKIKIEGKEKAIIEKIKPVFCLYRKTPPVIDADLKDWSFPFFLGKENFKTTDEKLTQEDLSAKVYTGWDEDFFYFAAEVTDSKFNQSYTGKKIWAGDSIQMAFDTLNDATIGSYDKNDYEYNLGLTLNGPEVSSTHGKTEELIKKVKLKVTKKGDKIYYEAAFPWISLSPFKVEEGNSMGFSLAIMDNDGEKVTNKWLELTPGICMQKNPSVFKDLTLIRLL